MYKFFVCLRLTKLPILRRQKRRYNKGWKKKVGTNKRIKINLLNMAKMKIDWWRKTAQTKLFSTKIFQLWSLTSFKRFVSNKIQIQNQFGRASVRFSLYFSPTFHLLLSPHLPQSSSTIALRHVTTFRKTREKKYKTRKTQKNKFDTVGFIQQAICVVFSFFFESRKIEKGGEEGRKKKNIRSTLRSFRFVQSTVWATYIKCRENFLFLPI